ncbi:MAG: hypothetical protein ACFCUU_17300 [Cyclobacteriaceae bacterium]
MFDQFYHQSSDQLKLSFLQKAFEKYPNLKNDFLEYYLRPNEKPLKMTIDDPDDFILASKDLIKDELEAININEPDWEYYVPRHSGYIPEHEAMEYLAEDEIGRFMKVYVSTVEKYCTDKHFDLAFLYMISIYTACMEAEIDDAYDTFYDANQTMLDQFEQHLQECISLFKVINLSEDQLYTVATVLFDYGQQYDHDQNGLLTFFEFHLHSVIHSGTQAAIVLQVIEDKNASESVPWLVTELNKKTGGQQAWEKSAKQFFKKNKSVAHSLLEFYRIDNKTEFVRIARELWHDGIFQAEFARLYFEVLEAQDDPDLYKEVTVHLNDLAFSEAYYRVLQSMMSPEERLSYIEKFKRYPPAYVQALCMEGKYDGALEFAGQHTNRWNIFEIFTPCLQGQPKAALVLLEKKIEDLLVDERGRNFYARVANVLKIAIGIPAIKSDVEKLAFSIYSFYSRLSALRDELRSAGLIKK